MENVITCSQELCHNIVQGKQWKPSSRDLYLTKYPLINPTLYTFSDTLSAELVIQTSSHMDNSSHNHVSLLHESASYLK